VISASRRDTINYLLAVVVLAGAAASLQAARNRGALQLIKKALPIRKPLDDLDRACVQPYEVLGSPRLSPEILGDLGTNEYVTWSLRAGGERVPWKATQMFVTYYTGVQDQVPHVPEECMTQGAFSLETDETFEMDMARLRRKISVRRLSFYPPPAQQTTGKVYVYYTICINGDFYPGRERARLRMADPHESHLYYSKVELSFDGLGEADVPTADQQASHLLDGVLTELVKSHWPKAGSERGGGSDAATR
jgi:hypothetical protein